MSAADNQFTGTWLDAGRQRGQQFSHTHSQYDHAEEGASGSTPMRHAHVEQNGEKVGVWVPADWSDDQAREALESNW
ncbi:hypothetical protein [Devosia rhizoryzae]|uniref:Uncharacterized protein n=1 Tax=Devosia rhizoryzae TaxID=2774137 RepID=A0ABX7CCA4_9HYPH|nr:hypothetical protein [Devosia rhizoryzae]QQR40919.1 hypothetical protein JI748_08050 [Devosia rhizoryzae]